jgi:hypothetical protein
LIEDQKKPLGVSAPATFYGISYGRKSNYTISPLFAGGASRRNDMMGYIYDDVTLISDIDDTELEELKGEYAQELIDEFDIQYCETCQSAHDIDSHPCFVRDYKTILIALTRGDKSCA